MNVNGHTSPLLLIAAACCLMAAAAPVVAETTVAERPSKQDVLAAPLAPAPRVAGDTIEDCWMVTLVPYQDSASTSGFNDDYDVSCPYPGSTSPDVVYCLVPQRDMCLDISLCESDYDTKLFIFASDGTTLLACSDDASCSAADMSYQSEVLGLEVAAYSVSYVVVDGYGGDHGYYTLGIIEADCEEPCTFSASGVPESETVCQDGYVDLYNGGCNESPESFIFVPVSDTPVTYAGTSGTYDEDSVRDTDWYRIYPCEASSISISVTAEFPVIAGFVDLREGCASAEYFYSYATGDPCETLHLEETLPLGPFAIVVTTRDWLGYPCGVEYELTVSGYARHCDPVPVKNLTWGAIRALYR